MLRHFHMTLILQKMFGLPFIVQNKLALHHTNGLTYNVHCRFYTSHWDINHVYIKEYVAGLEYNSMHHRPFFTLYILQIRCLTPRSRVRFPERKTSQKYKVCSLPLTSF